jgi:hypothetical protein
MRLVVFSCFKTARKNTNKKAANKKKKITTNITMNTMTSPPLSPLSPPSPPSPSPSESTTNSSRPRLTAATMDVMDSRVSKGTKASYCHLNAQFILWIYFGDDKQEVTGNSQERVGITSSTSSSRARDKSKRGLLFPGGNQYQQFMTAFHSVIRDNAEEFARLGVEPGDLGLY